MQSRLLGGPRGGKGGRGGQIFTPVVGQGPWQLQSSFELRGLGGEKHLSRLCPPGSITPSSTCSPSPRVLEGPGEASHTQASDVLLLLES